MKPSTRNRRRSLLSERVIALVTDEWQDMEEFMDQAVPLVPPGRAQRAWQMQRDRVDAGRAKREAAGKKVIARQPYPSPHDQQRQGARSIVNAILDDAREHKWLEIEVGATRRERRIRRSYERQYAHHCCLHGGSCRGTRDDDAAVTEKADDPLLALVDRVLASRRDREADPPTQVIREVFPGEIDRLLRECG